MAAEYDNDLEEMTLTCDNCGFEATFEGSWQSCIEQAKSDGWRIRKVGSNWEHHDDTCRTLEK